MNDVGLWWQSKIVWAQVLGIIFALSVAMGFDISGLLGVDEEGALAAVMGIIGGLTVVWRIITRKRIVSKPTMLAMQDATQPQAQPFISNPSGPDAAEIARKAKARARDEGRMPK